MDWTVFYPVFDQIVECLSKVSPMAAGLIALVVILIKNGTIKLPAVKLPSWLKWSGPSVPTAPIPLPIADELDVNGDGKIDFNDLLARLKNKLLPKFQELTANGKDHEDAFVLLAKAIKDAGK